MKIDTRIVTMIATGFLAVFLAAAAPSDNDPSVLVQVTKVRKGSLPQTVTGYGTAAADISSHTTITAPLAAVVADVYVRQGEEVPKGARLLRLVPNPQTSAAYVQAVSAAQNATQLLAHTQELYRQYLATKQDLANAQKEQADAQAALSALRSQGAQGPKIITTSFPAIVTKLSVSGGSTVDIGAPLVDLAPPDKLVLRIGVVPDAAIDIKLGNTAKIMPVGGNKAFEGKVSLRGSMVESGNGLVPIEISLPPGALLPGQTAQAEITTGSLTGYIIPHSAVLADDKGEPYIVQAVNMKAKIVPVRVLGMNGDSDIVDGKLDINAPLVLAGNYQLEEGMSVRLTNTPKDQNQ